MKRQIALLASAVLITGIRAFAASAQAEPIPADECVLLLNVPESATVSVDDTDYGTARRLVFRGLPRGKEYTSIVRVAFAGAGEAQRAVLVGGGRELRLSVMAPSRIVFWIDQDLYSIDPDGTGLRRLASTRSGLSRMQISPDGARIAFSQWNEDTRSFYIHVMNIDGGGATRLAEGVSPTWSPDGARICFSDGSLSVMNADGGNVRVLGGSGDNATWSPDGQSLAFDRTIKQGTEKTKSIYTIGANGGNELRWSSGERPRWSPDGRLLCFQRGPILSRDLMSVLQPGELFVLHVQNGTIQPIGKGEKVEWSPTGRRLAFVSEGDLYVADPDGRNRRQLTNIAVRKGDYYEEVEDFAWSPDGGQIVFAHWAYDLLDLLDLGEVVVLSRLYVIRADGAGLTQLVPDQRFSDSPDWR